MAQQRSNWKSNLGFLLAAIGSAIGLGNVWRFSYMAHQYGGGAFLVPYLVALIVAGVPIMIIEYGLGHREKGSSPLSFVRINKRFEWIGWWMPVVAMFGIMLYYSVVIGWCINYFIFSFNLSWGGDTQHFFFSQFLQLSDSAADIGSIRFPIAAATLFVWLICWFICYRDVRHGIEKASMIFMPILFLLTIVLVLWSVFLEGASDAIFNHYLDADWSKINLIAEDPAVRSEAGKVWAAAFGQIFFTLSLGFGIMITYASYLPQKTDIGKNAFITCFVNCLYSFIAGFAVFGIVGFMAHNQGVPFEDAIKGGPQLAFVVYPQAISLLPSMNVLFGVIFFLMLVIAGLTSGISLIEAFSCAITDKFDWARGKVVTAICILGFLGSIIFTTRGGLYLLDIADHFITNYGLVAGGLLECIIIGWVLKASLMRNYISRLGTVITPLWDILVKFITPIILTYLLYLSLVGDITENYSGYPTGQLILYGVGLMLVCLVAAFILTLVPWKPEKLQRRHRPEEDELLI
ncbi:MAG: sodium-dependent transporter [Deltaproteobacteria bacterium]|jgi:NSS family neurotransmitter:Na+ symporter|nr:sodium-dependent transporter [Deltaproteobacteria bacterium]